MSKHWKTIAAGLSLAVLLLATGCGSDKSTPATGEKSPESGGSASKKPDSDPQHPVVVIETSMGKITVRLNADTAPLTVSNFLNYVDRGHYDQTLIHQVLKGQFVLGGGYDTNGLERPVLTPVRNEAHNGAKNLRGTLAMARRPDDEDSATSQFFINVADNPALDHRQRTTEDYGYCVFGEVTDGLEAVVDRIANVEVRDTTDFERTPVQPVIINSIQRIK